MRIHQLVIAASIGLASSALHAQTLAQKVVGTWIPVSQYVDQGDKKVEPFGAKPKGMVVYEASGRFLLILIRSDLPKFASNNRMTGTPEEYKAVGQGSIAYYGRYTIDEKEGKIKLHYDGSTYPNWDGEDQVRLISVTGDELKIVSPVSTVGGGVVHLVLKRAN